VWAGSLVMGQRWAGRLLWLPVAAPRVAEAPAPQGTRYTTRDGDLLDWVAWRFYGRTADTVAAVLAANPGLAEWGPVLPGGLVVWLPEVPATAAAAAADLWQGIPEPSPQGASYTSREGDALDWVLWRHYGAAAGALETVLAANPGLAELGPLLPHGRVVVLPPLSRAVDEQPTRLWN